MAARGFAPSGQYAKRLVAGRRQRFVVQSKSQYAGGLFPHSQGKREWSCCPMTNDSRDSMLVLDQPVGGAKVSPTGCERPLRKRRCVTGWPAGGVSAERRHQDTLHEVLNRLVNLRDVDA